MAPKSKKTETVKTDAKAEKGTEAPKGKTSDGAKGLPTRPKKEDYEKRIEEVAKEIEGKKAEIEKVIQQIDGKSKGKEEYEEARKALFEQMATIKAQKSDIIEGKKELVAVGKQEKEEAFQAKKQLQVMEKEGRDLNEETLDRKIAEYEYMLNVRVKPLTLKEEKAIMMEMKKLKAARPKAQAHTKKLELLKAGAAANQSADGAAATATTSASREDCIKDFNAKLDKMKEDQGSISSKLDKLKEDRDAKMSNVKPLITKRTELRDEVSKLIEKKKAIVEERKKAFDLWKEHEKSLFEARKAKEDAEWDAWRKEKASLEAQKELEKPNPFGEEKVLLEQTVTYCKDLLPAQNKGPEAAKEIDYNNPEGYVVMRTKKDRDADMYFEATRGKKGKKGAQAQLPPKEEGSTDESSASSSKKPIKHTAETFAIFKQLGVKTPMTISELPDLMEELNKKLEGIKLKEKEWEAERLQKVEEARVASLKAEEEKAKEVTTTTEEA